MDIWLAFAEWVYDMQTLIVGTLALIAAGVTVHYLRKQIKQAQSHRADDIALNHTVARALSINATSEFMKSCEEFSNYFEETLGEWRKENISEYSEEQVSFKSF